MASLCQNAVLFLEAPPLHAKQSFYMPSQDAVSVLEPYLGKLTDLVERYSPVVMRMGIFGIQLHHFRIILYPSVVLAQFCTGVCPIVESFDLQMTEYKGTTLSHFFELVCRKVAHTEARLHRITLANQYRMYFAGLSMKCRVASNLSILFCRR